MIKQGMSNRKRNKRETETKRKKDLTLVVYQYHFETGHWIQYTGNGTTL